MMPQNRPLLALGVVFYLLVAPACAPEPKWLADLPPEPRPEWVLRITSSPGQTMTARVEDTRTGRAVRVYAGQEGALPLGSADGARRLRIEVAGRVFLTMVEFIPSDDLPCWELVIDSGPPYIQAQAGPRPCRRQMYRKFDTNPDSVKSMVQDTAHAALRRAIENLANCLFRELKLEGEYELHLAFFNAPDTVWAGSTLVTPNPPSGPHRADIAFELHWLNQNRDLLRVAVIHEVLHVVTAPLFVSLFAYDPNLALRAAEYVVQQMAEWRLWYGVCRWEDMR